MLTVNVTAITSPKAGFVRWRKPISRMIVAVFLTLLVFTDSPASPLINLTSEVAGILLIAAAVLGRIWCALYIAGRKNAELCADGPYSICRNPLYVFSFLGASGFVFAVGVPALCAFFAPLFWAYHHRVIQSEERRLSLLFGAAYDEYCSKVPRIFPCLGLYWSRPLLTIDPHVMLRALSDVAWFLVALAGVAIVDHLRAPSGSGASFPTLFTWPF